jgi:hypothetical protein
MERDKTKKKSKKIQNKEKPIKRFFFIKIIQFLLFNWIKNQVISYGKSCQYLLIFFH